MYYIAICDDNAEFLETIGNVIKQNPEYNSDMIYHTFLSGEELLKANVALYDFMMLDMQLEQMDGYVLAQEIRKRNADAVLAFCSGVVMPKPEHFEVQPYRYILKKVDTEKMQNYITDLLVEMKKRKKNNLVEVVDDGKVSKVKIKDIIYIYRKKRGSILVIEDGENSSKEVESNEKLADWYQQLSMEGFEFPHTSYIVNMQKIISIEKDDIRMNNNQLLKISRTCKQRFNERLSYYFSKKYRRMANSERNHS